MKALLAKHGKDDLSPDDAYIFITQTLTQDLYDAQATDQKTRDDVADQIRDKQSAIQDKIDQGRALGMDMSDAEKQVTIMSNYTATSKERASETVEANEVESVAMLDSADTIDFLLDDTLNL